MVAISRVSSLGGAPPAARRFIGIDSFRYLMCLPVAFLHLPTDQLANDQDPWVIMLACVCRIAVPFFFVVSGYFMRVPETLTIYSTIRPLIRLIPVYFAWFMIYAAVDVATNQRTNYITLRYIATGGAAYHLWFLPVLSISLVFLILSISLLGIKKTTYPCIALSLFGLIFGAYHDILHIHAIGGIRLTMAPTLILGGYIIRHRNITIPTLNSFNALLILLILIILEEYFIGHFSNRNLQSHDVVLITYPLGFTIFFLAKSLNGVTSLAIPAKIGTIGLGVYASHLLFLRILLTFIHCKNLLNMIIIAFLATFFATLFSILLSCLPVANKLVR